MNVLGVDTAGRACSVAVRCSGGAAVLRQRPLDRGHAEALVPLILGALAEAGLRPADIDVYGVTTGPGAFTGLRVGLATVGGMALAHDRPVIGVGTFEAIAIGASRRFPDVPRVLVAIESRRAELFARSFRKGLGEGDGLEPESDPFTATAEHLAATALAKAPLVLAGDGAGFVAEARGDTEWSGIAMASGPVDPEVVAAIAEDRSGAADLYPPVPDYLRAPDARPHQSSRMARGGARQTTPVA